MKALHLDTMTACMMDNGLVSSSEIAWLAETASHSHAIVEVGSWYGQSARAMADNMDGTILCVDDWYGPRDEGSDNRAFDEYRNPGVNLSTFRANLQGCKAHIRVWQQDHRSITPELISENLFMSPDFIFIDGDHSYESTKQDIENWLPFLAPNGIIAGHDYNDLWPGVLRAVDEAFPYRHLVPDTSIWYTQWPKK